MDRDAVKLAPSILAADFARLGDQVAAAEKAGADRIHVDVMDGHFVPNITMGPVIVHSLRPVTRLPLETHLMISDPDLYLEDFAEAGSDSLLVHWEGNNNLHRTVQRVKALGKRAGVVINPATPASVLEEILQDVDQVLVMTVNPGFGNQHFIHTTLPKIRRVRQMIDGDQTRLRPGGGRGHRCGNYAPRSRSRRQRARGWIGDFWLPRRRSSGHRTAAGRRESEESRKNSKLEVRNSQQIWKECRVMRSK